MTNAVVPTDLAGVTAPEVESTLLSPDISMVILTWLTFLFLLIVLNRFAWKPILKALDEREAMIRRSLADADRIKEELDRIHEVRRQSIHEAQEKAREMIDEARKAAMQASLAIAERAKKEADILLENARQDIKEETQKARMVLREESVRLAVGLAGKLIEENLDTEKNRKLIHRLMVET